MTYKKIKILFIGTVEFSFKALSTLIENKFEILSKYSSYKLHILPIFKLPYNLALIWFFFVTIYGRFINGDIALLLKFIQNIKKEKIFK